MNITSPNTYPEVALIQQRLQASKLEDLPRAVMGSLNGLPVLKMTTPGDTVAVAVGSRGIKHIDTIVFRCIQFLKNNGLRPFIVPAMGSHGGATSAGQKAVLEKFGISASTIGVPVCADMDVECMGKLPDGLNIYFSKSALTADHVVVINRIKPHTKFEAEIESGLCKMLTIGLGKAKGAAEFHRCAVKQSFKLIEQAAKMILKDSGFLFGLALLEDGYGNVAHVEAVASSALVSREKELLKKASAMMGRIPFDFLDILIVDFFGKDISGIGMDPNITGRHRDIVGDFNKPPNVKRIFVRDLSPGSGGNGNGIGLADVTTHRLVNALDIEKTYINAITAVSPEKVSIPMHFEDDRTCLDVCFKTIGLALMEDARMVRIKDTMSLEYLVASRALENEISSDRGLKQITPWAPLTFNESKNLTDLAIDRTVG
ncbi:MAG: DUF2088 domain-containing protein [Deltaproteobacteria bacterium]|nr:DUF2088 domain-containing protein [Deltaproteobacteria bacterium]